ncbi:MAG: hypothetical protein JW779_15395 [Candidatus Thorarchaeota archaeon]|nr:hypothetical protein [Candidatus Thorarchaeota archaeon]
MIGKELRALYPISWLSESTTFVEFVNELLSRDDAYLLVGDFASGEHDRVPSFFTEVLPKFIASKLIENATSRIYCIDLHSLRLDSLLGKLEETNLLSQVRVVQAKLETMDKHAFLRPSMIDYLENHQDELIWLDDFLIGEKRFPPGCFDIGIFNNDIIGYLHEYYKESSDFNKGLQTVHRLMKKEGLLVVANPCSLYVVDNVAILENNRFKFIEGIDIDLSTSTVSYFESTVEPNRLSRLNHYTFMLFRAD